MALENPLSGLGLTPQCAGKYRIEANVAAAEIVAEQPRLAEADFGQTVVVFGAERRLPMTHKVDCSHYEPVS